MAYDISNVPIWGWGPSSTISGDQWAKKKLIIFTFFEWSSIRVISGHFWPPTVAPTGPKVPIWTLTPKSIIWVLNRPKYGPWLLILFIFSYFFFMVIFSHFGLWGGGLLEAFMGPCYGLLCPTGPHMELGPQVCHFRWSVGKNNAHLYSLFYFRNFWHFRHFFAHFWPFLTPHCGSNWAQGPHMDLNPEVYYLRVESAKNWTLIIDSGHFFDFFISW